MTAKNVTIKTVKATLMKAEPYTLFFPPDEMPELGKDEYLEAELDLVGDGTEIRRVICPDLAMLNMAFDFYLSIGPCKLKWYKMVPISSVQAVFVNVSSDQ